MKKGFKDISTSVCSRELKTKSGYSLILYLIKSKENSGKALNTLLGPIVLFPVYIVLTKE